MPAKRKPEPKIIIELLQGYDSTTLKAKTILEGLEALKPDHLRAKTVMVVRKGEKKAEIVLYPRVLRRLLVNPIARLITEKRLTNMLA